MRHLKISLVSWLALCVLAQPVPTQEVADAGVQRGPRFLYAASYSGAPVRLDIGRTPVLSRRVTLDLRGVTLEEALEQVSRQAGLKLSYSKALVPLSKRVRLTAQEITVAGALGELLFDVDVDVLFTLAGHAVLVRRNSIADAPPLVGAIRGRVVDSASTAGIVRVTVSVEGTRLSAMTAADGSYHIASVPAGTHSVTARRLGYKAQTHSVSVSDGETAMLDFVLADAPTTLNEIVVTPTGDRRRLEVGNAIGTIKADSIVPTTLIRNVSDLLTARTPGVVVVNATGGVGSPSKVRIRGLNSIRLNNDPIIILDGVRLQSQTTRAESQTNTGSTELVLSDRMSSFASAGFAVPRAPSRLDDIDPNIIESIDVLRGPSAASLYGTEAANGVVVIKTKRGRVGGFRSALSVDQGWSYLPGRLPDLWYGWGHTPDGQFTIACGLRSGMSQFGLEYSVLDGTCVQDSVTAYNPQNDPYMTTLGMGSARSIAGTISGGSEQLQNILSFRTTDNVGIAKMSDFERNRTAILDIAVPAYMERPNAEKSFTGTERLSARVGERLDVSLSASGVYRKVRDNGAAAPTGLFSSLSGLALGGAIRNRGDSLQFATAELSRGKFESLTKRGLVSASATYTPSSWLVVRGTLGGDYVLRTDDALALTSACSVPICFSSTHSNARNETFVTTLDFSAQLLWRPLSWLSLRTTVGEQYANTKFYHLFAGNSRSTQLAFGTDLLSPAPTPSSTSAQLYDVREARDEGATAGWYIEESFNVRERLFLTTAFRQDAASAFGSAVNRNPPVYPKFSASWVLSDEAFFPASRYVNSVRLRSAYGHSGQQGAQGDVLNSYSVGNAYVNGELVPGIALVGLGNPGLRPERTAELEGGIDVGLLPNERVTIEATLYRKLSEDAIVSIAIPRSYGIGTSRRGQVLSQRANIGSVENRGFELAIAAKLMDSPTFSWDVSVNMGQNSNKLVSKDPRVSLSASQFRVGYPIYGTFGRKLLSYSDVNGDGILAFEEAVFSDTTLLGAPYPRRELSYHSSIGALSGTLRFNVSVGHVVGGAARWGSSGYNVGAPRAWVDRTASLEEQAAAVQAAAGNGFQRGGQYVMETSTIRIGELSATYNMRASWARRFLRAHSASVTLAGRNVGLWTNYPGVDPNIDTGLSEYASDHGNAIPQPRNWIVRVNLGF